MIYEGETHQVDPFIQKYGPEFAHIPIPMRERVAYLIDAKVERQVQYEMNEFRTEVKQELYEQRVESQNLIKHYHHKGEMEL